MQRLQNALVVDDDPVVRTLIHSYLVSFGCEHVQEAENGEQALDHLKNSAQLIELVVCDLKMPRMDGLEFLQALKEHQYEGEIVIISGETSSVLNAAKELSIAYGLRLRASIFKPITKRKLDDVFSANVADQGTNGEAASQGKLAQSIRDNKIFAYYQPRICQQSGQVVGVEASAYCLDEKKGVVDARSLQPAFGNEAVTRELSNALLEKALQQIRTWKSRGLKLNTGIEFPSASLIASGFYDSLLSSVAEAGAEPQDITIAIDQTDIQRNFIDLLSVVARMRLQGFNFSIKNFKADTNSYELLCRLPINQLELDAGAMSGDSDDSADALEQASVLARQRDISIVVSGLDSEEMLDALPNREFHVVQGKMISDMMPGPELEQWYLKVGGKFTSLNLSGTTAATDEDAAAVLRAVS